MYFANLVPFLKIYSLYLLGSTFTTSFYNIAIFWQIPVNGRKSHMFGKMAKKLVFEK